MTIHEFGKKNEQIVVLVHPAIVMWDYFEYVIPLMEDQYHLRFRGMILTRRKISQVLRRFQQNWKIG